MSISLVLLECSQNNGLMWKTAFNEIKIESIFNSQFLLPSHFISFVVPTVEIILLALLAFVSLVRSIPRYRSFMTTPYFFKRLFAFAICRCDFYLDFLVLIDVNESTS